MSIKCRRGSVLWRDICDFFFVFSAENCSALSVWCVRFHKSREREECFFSRGAETLSSFCFSFSSSRCPFFSQKENKQSSFLSFLLLCLSFAFFLSFVSHERDLRFKEKSHLTHRHYIKHDS